ncbi:retrovirus-related pol polyprotein from transposon TNT 1-94 [Tanacetum coccineum]
MDESIPWDQKCKSSKELFKIKKSVDTIFDGVERCKQTIAKRTYFGNIDPFIQNTIEGNFCPQIRRINADLEKFHLCLNEEMVADLRYFNSLEHEVDTLKSQLETQKTQFLNEIDRLSREYYYADHMNAILGVYTDLDEVTNLQCDYLETLEKCEHLEKELSKSRTMSKSFEALQKHAINLELDLQQCKEKIKNDKSFKENQSNVFLKEREQYFEIQDLKAQLQDKGIAISELKKLIEKMKGKSVETKFEKSSVIRQPNAFKSQRQSILGKPAIFSDSLAKTDFSKSKSVTTQNVSHDFSKPVTAQILPQNVLPIFKNTNVIAPGMYKVHTKPNQTRTPRLPQEIRKTNKRVSFSTGVIPNTSVSRPQLKSNQLEDRVMSNNSQGKKQEVEDHRRNFKFSNNKTSVTACNDNLNAKNSNVNFVCVTCGKCVLNDNHDLCVLHYLDGVNSRTRQPIAVPISTREPKHNVNQSVATSSKKTITTDSTIKKSRNITRKLYEQVSKTCSWWYPKYTPPRYNWKPKSQIGNVNPNVSMPLGNASRTANILEHKTPRCSTVSNTPLSSNSFAARMVKFGNDQIALILGYGDLVQGKITIKRVYYVEGLNHNLFSVGQFCDADLEVAFRKSTCYICYLKGNDLLTGSRGTDLYSITLQETTTPNLICLMANATSSQAWLWHRRLSHLNFVTINLLSKNNIVTSLPKLKFVKDHLCSSCELGKAKKKTHFLRSKDETLAVLIDFLTLVQRGLHAQVRTVRTDKGTQNCTLVEAARTMLSTVKVPLFFWAQAIATTYGENLDKMKEKGDASIFVGYSNQSRAYRVFNKRTRIIVETIHVNFDELPQMASDHVSSDPVPQCLTTTLEHCATFYTMISAVALIVMSSASSAVTYTSVYTDSKPDRVFWGADEEIADRGIPPRGSTDTAKEYEDDETEDGPVDYPMDGRDDGDDDDDGSSSSGDSAVDVPTDENVSPPEGIEPVIPPPSTDITIGARITVRTQASISLPPEAEVERLLAMTTPSPSPPILLSPPSAGGRLARCMASPAHSSPPPVPSPLLPSSGFTATLPSPPLLPPLYIPLLVDHREDIPESEQPPRKRLCLSTLGSRYEIRESSTARPTEDRGVDYGFVSIVDVEARRQGISEVGYGIRDTWVNPTGAVPEIAPMTDLYALLEDAQDRDSMDGGGGGLCFPKGLGSLDRIELGDPSGASDLLHQAQMVETLCVIKDMRLKMGDMQAELLALREQRRRARQPATDARIVDHQDASRDADSHV